MERLQIAAGAGAVIAAAWLLMFPVPETTYVRPPRAQPPQPAPQASILFGGDMMFDRSIRSTMDEKGNDYVFSCIALLLRGADIVVANLEGPITPHSSRSVGTVPGGEGNFTFTFPSSTAALLASHNVRLVNVGNNHILNFGWEGLRSTTKYLREASVSYFGDPKDASVEHEAVDGLRLSFINYNEFAPKGSLSSASTTLSQIQAARAAGEFPIVYTHWGEEYVAAGAVQKNLAREFVDAGAELVVGSHPHIVQEHEVYKGKYIYYSLGNLIFDQYWGDNVRNGLLLKVVFDSKGVHSIAEIPVHLERDRRTCPVR